ncbi:methylaspartate ammonia-lyase [uncultured Ezakiella sp.]|uniref:methylaspartate ammonia-lyase n=1 Tax=uncultured Ezakiella sp. TaxID=1637529 RepID=UPI0025FEAD66|nr:methylaspartate ammonia-lyase [uncultured Ezakiella sp.]
MKIVDVVASAGKTGFYFDDQKAIKMGAGHDGMFYVGEPQTEGFTKIRIPGESISVMLILDDGQVAFGDCAAVQYSGAGGRDPLFLAEDYIPLIEGEIRDHLIGKELNSFKELAEEFDHLQVDGHRLHTAIRYGITQALLDAVAKAKHITRAEVVHNEYKIGEEIKRVPIFAQSGDDRYSNADKMIIKEADVLPHGLFNNVEEKTGKNGELLLEYIEWLRDRIIEHRAREDYNPIFHIDVYGTIGDFTGNDVDKMAEYMKKVEAAAKPFAIRIEGPMDMGDKDKQIEVLAALTKRLDADGTKVELVADEWCNTLEDIKAFVDAGAGHVIQIKTPDLGGINNTIEAVKYCRENNVGAYCGGTCNETSRSAEILTNISMATGALQQLAKPGMGVDEGIMLVNNEMSRVERLVKMRQAK